MDHKYGDSDRDLADSGRLWGSQSPGNHGGGNGQLRMGQRPRLDRSCWEIQRRGQEETVSFLEQFESSLSFQDMDRERAAAYGGPLEDSYAFYGRETEDGAEAMSWGSKYGRRAFWTGLRCMERTIIWRQ